MSENMGAEPRTPLTDVALFYVCRDVSSSISTSVMSAPPTLTVACVCVCVYWRKPDVPPTSLQLWEAFLFNEV